jgi:aspartyl-tRNA(Asn)/glutamyl-tRNA(Gln) amidotransferase subunit B
MVKSVPDAAGIAPEVPAKYELVIGLEVHVQLLTKSKIFCGCSTRFGDPPNTNVCPVCLGLPGALPVLNVRVRELAARAAVALNCKHVVGHSRFARKNYFYPDLPKGYQISQYELPLATGGWLEINLNGERIPIGITRLHVEEDAAKNLHEGFAESAQKTYIDYNRCGIPLCEIVSEPDMHTSEHADAYLNALRERLLETQVSDCNMEEGSLRCDANVSVRPHGSHQFGTKVEIKNLNSFRFVRRAIDYELNRQVQILESGRTVVQETRLWDQLTDRTESMRSKEQAHDYRYFPEPDLLPVYVSSAFAEEIRRSLPEFLDARRLRFVRSYGITPYDAEVLTATQPLADYFEAVAKAGGSAKSAANWMQTELLRRLNDSGKEIDASPVSPAALAALLELVESGQITGAVGKKVFASMFESGRGAAEIVAAEGLAQISDTSAIQQAAREVIAKNPENVAKYKSGNEGVFKFFVGQVMRATRGQANPQLVNQVVEILTKILGPAGRVPREKYEDILKNLREARNWAEQIGGREILGRFREYEGNIEALIRARESSNLDTFVKAKGNDVLMWSLAESMEVGDLPDALRNVEPSILKDRLRRAFRGPIIPVGEDANTNDARNIMFELVLASFLSSAGFDVSLRKEVDIEASVENYRFVVECKRLQSEKRFGEQLGKACEQIGGVLDKDPAALGLIAVDITKLRNTGTNIYVASTSMSTKVGLGNLLETTLRENLNSLKKIDDRRIVGLMLYIHTPAFIRDEALLTAAKQLALWPLCPPGSSEMKALGAFASKVMNRIERS